MRLHTEVFPKLAPVDILFIHGNLASSRWWCPTVEQWERKGSMGSRSLLAADWRGCGQNPEWDANEPFSIRDLAEDYLELLRERGDQRVALVGHSLGGLIALQMMILDPERFTQATLLNSVGPQGVIFDDSMYAAFRAMALNQELCQQVVLSTVLNGNSLNPAFQNKIGEDAFQAVRGIGLSVLEILKSVDLREEARRVKVPTLLLHGRHDSIIPLSASEELHHLLPHSNFSIIEDAGHCWNVENPSAFVEKLREWHR